MLKSEYVRHLLKDLNKPLTIEDLFWLDITTFETYMQARNDNNLKHNLEREYNIKFMALNELGLLETIDNDRYTNF